MQLNPLVSIIIPTRNEESNIKDCLESIRRQSYRKKEVIIVDGDSTDRTIEIAKKYGAEVLQESPLIGPANARNIGAKKAKGQILFFVDADLVLDKHTISKGVKHLLKQNLDAIIPLTVIYPTKELVPNLFYAERLASKIDICPNFFKRKVFLKFLFNSNLGMGEDFELSQRLTKGKVKYRLIRDVITYHKEPDLKRLISESRWWGRTYFSLLKIGNIGTYFSFFWIIFVSILLPLLILSFFISELQILSYITLIVYFSYSIFKICRSIINGAKIKYAILIPFFKMFRYSLLFVGMLEGIFKKPKFKGE